MTIRIGLLITAMALLLGGCMSRLTGNEGNFEFSYWTDDKVTDFNKPIAVGAYLDVEVHDVGWHQAVELSEASFDDQSILMVDSYEAHRITIAGMGDGPALLSVAGTTTRDETLTDSVNMLAATPEVLVLRHSCTQDSLAAALTEQRVWLPFEMEKINGQPVIGYGYYPVTVTGDSATLNVDDSTQMHMAFDTAPTIGMLELASDIDATTLSLDVVTPADITDVEEPTAWVLEDIDVGDTNAFFVRPMSNGQVICQANVTKTVLSDTPAICDVRDRDPETDGSDASYEYGWFEIEGLAEGLCEYTVTYSDGAAGLGASGQFFYPIEP